MKDKVFWITQIIAWSIWTAIQIKLFICFF